VSNLRAFPDGLRVLRTVLAERRQPIRMDCIASTNHVPVNRPVTNQVPVKLPITNQVPVKADLVEEPR
jgi:hypothetical protein